MYHHSSKPYAVAVSEAAAEARKKFEKMFEPGVKAAEQVVARVQSEVPSDALVRAPALRFQQANDDVQVLVGDQPRGLIRHAMGQICESAGLPIKFANELKEHQGWGAELLAHNLNTIYSHQESSRRYLVRSVGSSVRGFLSDRFRRLDCRPLLEAFVGAASQIGCVPVAATSTETKVEIRAMLPMVFEPVPGEVMAYGLSWSNSDFGNGTHSIKAFALRLWCTNGAIMEEMMKNVHLGGRISDSIQFSERTYRLDTRTTASAIGDVVRGALSAEAIDRQQARILAAHNEKIDPKGVPARLGRMGLGKGEADEIGNAFKGPDVELLPAGDTTWRLSNAISWFARYKCEDELRGLELQQLAGKLLVNEDEPKAGPVKAGSARRGRRAA